MISSELWVDASSDFLMLPNTWAEEGELCSDCQKSTGKKILQRLAKNGGWNLVQTVASAVAIPFQILVGVFSCLHQCARGNWKGGASEFRQGFVTAGVHVAGLLLSPFLALRSGILIAFGSLYLISKWNQPCSFPSEEKGSVFLRAL